MPLEATSAQELFIEQEQELFIEQEHIIGSFMKWLSMVEQPKITMRNAQRRLEWCKARHHWILEQWKRVHWSDESRFTIWQSDG